LLAQTRTVSILTFNNGINRAALLAVSAVDTLGHIDIISRRPSAAVFTLFRFNGNSLRGTNSLTQLTGNAALFA
jgi:hypothetical protein